MTNKWCQTQQTSSCAHCKVLRFREFKGKLKRPQTLSQLKGRCTTITIPHNIACLKQR